MCVYLTCRGNIDIDCGDTIDTNRVATVDRNTNDALVVVDGKLQDVSYPCPRYDVIYVVSEAPSIVHTTSLTLLYR